MKNASFLFAAVFMLGAEAVAAQAPTVIYAIRHAETAADSGSDPALSAAGRQRVAGLTALLEGISMESVYSTSYRRTRETATPVAQAHGRVVQTYDPAALPAFAQTLRSRPGRHLVVGHSNTTPALVQALGGSAGSPIAETEYDRLYVVSINGADVQTQVLRLSPVSAAVSAGTQAAIVRPPALADVETIDGIIAALYDVISGPAGQARDWDRMRGLFFPGARMIPVQKTPDGRTVPIVITVEQYITQSGPSLTSIGFTESELARRTEEFGDVAHVFSTYVGYREGATEPVVRGLNSIQLVNDGKRWWIAQIAWSQERPDLPIPAQYLRDDGHE